MLCMNHPNVIAQVFGGMEQCVAVHWYECDVPRRRVEPEFRANPIPQHIENRHDLGWAVEAHVPMPDEVSQARQGLHPVPDVRR